MDSTERAWLLEQYDAGYARVVEVLEVLPRDAWHFKPAPECWSIHEIIIHLADSEAAGYFRCRKLIAEPGSTITPYDEQRWAEAFNYPAQDTEQALELFRLLRSSTYSLLKQLPDSVWSHSIHHPERGTMTLTDWLQSWTNHVAIHTSQMLQTYQVSQT
ncbi:MAG: DinB family protein [Ardenticatenaceae bacterium]